MADKLYHDTIKYDIIENCNLNCRNCGHFSQFKTSSGERSIQEIEDDLTLLCSKIDMGMFCIFGGEPLLHSNINGVMMTIRRVLGKNVEIRLLTNGLKIPTMKESFFLTAKTQNIIIELTEYPIKVDYERIENEIKLRGVQFKKRVTDEFWNFMDPTGTQDPVESFRLCKICRHTYYERGNIFLCAYVKSVPFVNEHFNTKIEYDSVPISASVDTIKDYLNHPCSTCRFCKSARQGEPWRLHDKNEKI